METSLTRIGYKIPYTDKEFKRIKNDLVVKPFIIAEYDYGNKPFPVYRKNDTHIYMPKYYGIEKYGIPQTFNERLGNNIKLKFKGKLHDYQQDIMNEVKDIIYSKDSCVLSIPPGGGKTICALWMISQLGKKTLILVHKEFLLNQWIERIEQFLPEARIGIIQQNKVDIEDKDIVIGMIQSIVSRKYPREIFDSFALTTVDECFPYSQLIVTEDGPQKIGYIYRMWEKNEKIPKVLSFNKETNILEYKKITYAWKKINDELLKINYGQGSIECTYNHKILTPNGYVEAKNLDIGDLIKCSLQEKEINIKSNVVARDLNEDQYQIFLGSFLGDGSIQKLPSNRYRLKVIHSEKQKEYCEWKASMFNCKINKIEKNGYSQTIAYNFTSKVIDISKEKEIPKIKNNCPQWILDELDYKGLAIWWMDDGHLSKDSFVGCLSTCSFDEDTHIRMIKKFKSMDIECYYKFDGKGYYSIYFNKKGLYSMIKKINKYLHPSMLYKFKNKKLEISSNEYFNGTIKTNYTNINNINNKLIKEGNIFNIRKIIYYIKKCNKCNDITFHSKKGKYKDNIYLHCCYCKFNKLNYISIEPPNYNETYHWNNKFIEFGTVKIKSIEKIKNKGRFYNGKVYDIEVEDNHNFVLSTGIKNKYGPIVHNCHRICSRSFSQALFHVGTKYSLGLSATPHRKDGLSKLLNWFLGDIVTPDSKCKDLKPIIKIIKAKYDKQPEITYNMRGKVNIATLITTISMDPIRNQLILDEITQALKDNRKILVMTERRVQCEQLEYLITKQGISMSVGIYIGGMTNEALEETNTRDIIISTYAMTAEGYDNKKIDTLIMATPRSEIEQILGRCMRQKNKNDPLVIDIVDNLEGLGGQAIKRERYYRKKGYIKPKPKVNNKKYMFLEDE